MLAMLTIDEFLKKYENKSWDFDGVYNAQCFDLFQFYNRDVVGAPFVTGAAAKDIWNTYPQAFYEKIPNGPSNYPKKGDVMIWGSAYGIYGHVAICSEDGNPQTDSFTVLSQNDPAGVPSIYKTYKDWKGVLGWLRPKPKVETPLEACLRQHGELMKELEALKKEHEKCGDYSIQLGSLQSRVLTLERERNEAVNALKDTADMKNRLLEKIDKAKVALS